jgi:drug/metabolite transporter (DMT)-like permease
MPATRQRAEGLLVAVSLGWGASFVVIKDALEQIGPHTLLVARFAVAALALLVLFPRALRGLDARSWRAGVGSGVVLWAAFTLQTLGLVHTTPAKSAFLTAVYLPLVPLLGRALFGRALGPGVLASAGFAFAGLILLTWPDAPSGGVGGGEMLTLGCAVAFALHILIVDRSANRVRSRPLAILQLGTTALLGLPFAAFLEPLPRAVPTPGRGWIAAVLYLGLVCSAFAYWAQSWAQRTAQPARVAVIFGLESVFAAAFAVVLYGERLSPAEWLGGGLVVGAVLLGRRSEAVNPV